ncbi:DUF4129 domain-containing protein [Sphingomonas sp. URHD0057]|uniref:DUF4129 domain-containing protein n=1 Tax=Sphingomonas sp. URHD0057 TaxID=1380389 RepID=UPI00048AE49F|nr:DUF4129 domain-containing protein [Sphingomonas sp. URHD0057]
MTSDNVQSAAAGADRFAQAYRALRADPSVQFNLAPPPPTPTPPAWLAAFFDWLGKGFAPIGRFFKWIVSFLPDAPYARILLWSVVAIAAAALLWALYNRLRYGVWRLRLPRLTAPHEIAEQDEWRPEEAGARSWLEEADGLARDGRFAEAIHHLLFRSVEDIARRRPLLVKPALTSRELAASNGIPGTARGLFASIAALVERSLFGGRAVGERDWLEARHAYADFALAAAWRP